MYLNLINKSYGAFLYRVWLPFFNPRYLYEWSLFSVCCDSNSRHDKVEWESLLNHLVVAVFGLPERRRWDIIVGWSSLRLERLAGGFGVAAVDCHHDEKEQREELGKGGHGGS